MFFIAFQVTDGDRVCQKEPSPLDTYYRVNPPSTTSICPVTAFDISLAKYMMAFA